jgi:hypothetical protein
MVFSLQSAKDYLKGMADWAYGQRRRCRTEEVQNSQKWSCKFVISVIITEYTNKWRSNSEPTLNYCCGNLTHNNRFLSSPQCLDLLWGPPNILSSEYQGLFLNGDKVAISLSSANVKNILIYLHSPIHLHGILLNEIKNRDNYAYFLNTGTAQCMAFNSFQVMQTWFRSWTWCLSGQTHWRCATERLNWSRNWTRLRKA